MAQKMASLAVSLMVIAMGIMHGGGPVAVMADGLDIGICYGMVADNLPPATEVIDLYKQHGITKVRLFDPNHDALEALRGTKILVSLGVRNEDIQNIASSIDAAASWFAENVQPYLHDVVFAYITVGNEVAIPGEIADSIVPAMKNLRSVLESNNLSVFVTTVVPFSVLGVSYPPSAADFSPEAKGTLVDILNFLSATGTPILVNIYPYFAYASDPVNIRLDYAQFTATEAVVNDGDLSYLNLLDAMTDAFSWAIEKQGVTNVGITISESGWPSDGNGELTTPELASTYNRNFMIHILSRAGTPKRPGAYVDAFIFAMFNEDQKAEGVERNWGLFYPNKEPVYQVFY